MSLKRVYSQLPGLFLTMTTDGGNLSHINYDFLNVHPISRLAQS